MTDKDDQDWLRVLGGESAHDGDPATRREAEAVRRAICAARVESPSPDVDVEGGVQRLLFRLRRDGLADSAKRRPRWQSHAGLAIAASLVAVIGLVTVGRDEIQVSPDAEVTRYRGAPAQVLTTDNPRELKDTLTRELQAAGLTPNAMEFGNVITLEAEWPDAPAKAATDALARHDLKPPEGNVLRVELHPPGKGPPR